MFHQCSGRAGRRGFDNKGQVVIFDIPQIEVNRLLTAKNPKIIGSLGITVIREMKTLFLFSPFYLKNLAIVFAAVDDLVLTRSRTKT